MLHSDGHCLMIIRVVIVDLVELVITVVFFGATGDNRSVFGATGDACAVRIDGDSP